ncbi:MAG: glycosyltransferase family 4 protein [Saprospiraceae bacterium]|nr:glycosyltransferase family 4 protein [Saprospiraceae bacterium]
MVVHDVAYLHLIDNERFIYRMYYKFFIPLFLKRADRIVTVSDFTRQDLLTHFDFLQKEKQAGKEKIAVACNGVRDFFYPLSIDDAKNGYSRTLVGGHDFFLFVGAVHPRKNVHRLIEAFDLFKQKTAAPHKLVIVGRFAWHTGIVKTAFDNAKHKNDIIFTGYLPDKAVANLTASAFALCYVSLFEGFGVPILEAFHTETPVITSNTSSMPEVAGDAALLVSPDSVEDIAKAMVKLYQNPELRLNLIAKGKIQREKFSWKKQQRFYTTIF